MVLHISIVNKMATYQQRDGSIVCGNTGYEIEFAFDSEWNESDKKTARFVYMQGSETVYEDVEFTGNRVEVPPLFKTKGVSVGVFADKVRTSTPAFIPCRLSILCESGNTK